MQFDFTRKFALVAGGSAVALLALVAVLIFSFADRSPSVQTVKAPPRVHHVASVKPKPVLKPAKAKPKPELTAFQLEERMTFRERMKRWDPYIEEAAKRFSVPQTWLRAVMQAESGGRTTLAEGKPITSTMGAMGLMQLMPETYEEMRVLHGLGKDPYDPRDNILAAAAYLKFLRARYGYPTMFAAYNDGPGNLEQRMLQQKLLPEETRNYLSHVTLAVEKGIGASGRNLARLTRPNGAAVMIDAASVVSVRAAFPGEYAPGVKTVVTVGRKRQGVVEPLARARAIIRAHGGAV